MCVCPLMRQVAERGPDMPSNPFETAPEHGHMVCWLVAGPAALSPLAYMSNLAVVRGLWLHDCCLILNLKSCQLPLLQVHQRVPLFVGSKSEVEYLESFF